MDEIKYPVGTFTLDKDATAEKRAAWIAEIAGLPLAVRRGVQGLSPEQLDTPYREGGWSTRQIVHHLADSQMNAFLRFKLGLTEQNPRISAFDQNAWARTVDGMKSAVAPSLAIIQGVHGRWAELLASLAPADFARTYAHPERGPEPLERTLQLYAWHGRHHLAHVTSLRERKGWR